MQDPGSTIPQTNSKHSSKLLKCGFDTEAFECSEHHLTVAVATEAVAEGFEVQSEIGKVVDLAVKGHDKAAVTRQHRLMAGIG